MNPERVGQPGCQTRYDIIFKSSVHINFKRGNISIWQTTGIIVKIELNYAYIIADACEEKEWNDLRVTFHHGEYFDPVPRVLHIHGGLIGIRCSCYDTSLVKMIKICDRPLQMSEAVYTYESVHKTLFSGLVTRIYGRQFSHSSGVATVNTEFGAPVINKDAELVGICCSHKYHLNAISISALVGTIKSIVDTLHLEF